MSCDTNKKKKTMREAREPDTRYIKPPKGQTLIERQKEICLVLVNALYTHLLFALTPCLPVHLLYRGGSGVDDVVHCGPVLHSPLSDAL